MLLLYLCDATPCLHTLQRSVGHFLRFAASMRAPAATQRWKKAKKEARWHQQSAGASTTRHTVPKNTCLETIRTTVLKKVLQMAPWL